MPKWLRTRERARFILGHDIDVPDALALRGINALYGNAHVQHDVLLSVKQGRVLLLDARSESVAPKIVHEMGDMLQALKSQGYSIVRVKQNATPELRVADDIVILNTGRIVYDGAADDARNQPGLLHAHPGIY